MNKILLFLPILLFSQVIKFSPLPVDTANNLYKKYNPLLEYLSKQTGDTYKFVYIPTYKRLLQNFKKGKNRYDSFRSFTIFKIKTKF